MPLTWLEKHLLGGIIKYIAKRTRRNPIMKNVITSTIGTIGAIVNAAYPLITNGDIPPETIIISVIMALLGFFAKDFTKTGTGM